MGIGRRGGRHRFAKRVARFRRYRPAPRCKGGRRSSRRLGFDLQRAEVGQRSVGDDRRSHDTGRDSRTRNGPPSPRRWHSWRNIAPLRGEVMREWIGAGRRSGVATFEHSTSREQDPSCTPTAWSPTSRCVRTARPAPSMAVTCTAGKWPWARCTGRNWRATSESRLPVQIDRDRSRFAIRGVPEAIQAHFFPNGRTRFRSGWPRTVPRGESGGSGHHGTYGEHKPEIDRPALFDRWQWTGTRAGLRPEQAAQRLARSVEQDGPLEPALADMREGWWLTNRPSPNARRGGR